MRTSMIVMTLIGVSLLAGCSEPPAEALEKVESAFQDAEAAHAAEYAPETMQAAEDARARLQAELEAQEQRFGLFRSYGTASELAAEATAEAVRAATDAEAGKLRTREEAERMLASARAALTQARSSLRKAPTGKGTQSDLAIMKADLDGVEVTLEEADAAYLDERFLDAKIKAEAAQTTALAVQTDIENALEATRMARRRR